MINKFKDISLKKKISLLLLLPLLSFLWAALYSLHSLSAAYTDAQTTSKYVTLSANYSAVAHEMQKERGLSAGYIGSKGSSFKDKLDSQRLP